MNSIQQLFSLEGQTALVTGGTRGIGQAMALALAEAGADILLVQRDASNQTTKTAIESLGRKATIYTADLSSPPSLSTLVPTILADGHRISILLNCGGIQRRHPAHEFPSADWDAVLQVNLSAVFTLCRDVGAHMLAQPGYVATEMNAALMEDPERAAGILARIPAGRWGAPEDFKGAVVYLASQASAYVSGEVLTVDGGWMGR